MIRYKIKTGDKLLNMKGREQRDFTYKPVLKGMRCSKCRTDTIIEFMESDFYGIKAIINPCCDYFDNLIRKKLWLSKD